MYINSQAQKKLIISTHESLKKNKSIEMLEGSSIEISYFKDYVDTLSLNFKENLSLTYGRIQEITTDTLIIKKFLSRKRIVIPVNSIFQLRKPTATLIAIPITGAMFVSGYYIAESSGYFLPAPLQWSIPAISYIYLDRKVINPMKTVNKNFYNRKNIWVLRIE